MEDVALKDVRSSASKLDRMAVARDLWPGGTLDMWLGRAAPLPDRVYWPESNDQVLSVLREAERTGTSVIPYGAGSGVCAGARGREGAVVLDLKSFQDLGPIDEDRWTVEVGAGVNGQHLEDYLRAHGYTLGHSPSSIWCSTPGGWAAARGAGQFSSKYGVFEDMVLGLTAVSPTRGVFSVGEGHDAPSSWMAMILGSEGTLCAITRLRLRIWPVPETRWLRGYRFTTVADALDAMRQLMQGELWPSVVRLYDPADTRIGGKTRPKTQGQNQRFYTQWLKWVDGLPGVRKRSLSLPLALPGLVNRLFDAVSGGCLVVVSWEGQPEVVEALSAAGHAILCERAEDLGAAPGERWFNSRHAVSYKLMPIFERGGFADTMEVATTWSNVEALYNAVRDAVGKTAVVMAHMSHAYPEGSCIYFSFAGIGDREVYDATWVAALEAVVANGGTVTHHHGVGESKAAAASAEVGPAIAGWWLMKSALDAEGVMNPGRVFVEVPFREPPATRPLDPIDALARADIWAPLAERQAACGQGEVMWPWQKLPGLPRWQRAPYQVSWNEVSGVLEEQRCVLGRGPRSASGSDLRHHLAEHGESVQATFAVAPAGERWMGEARPENPWRVARALLRSDLRPAVLTVEAGALRVGFRGPAAQALGGLASAQVEGGLSPVDWRPAAMPSMALMPCDETDPDACWVTAQSAFKPVEAP